MPAKRIRTLNPDNRPMLLGLLSVLVIVAGIFWYGARIQQAALADVPPLLQGPQSAGQAKYDLICANCHGFRGEGLVEYAKPLNSLGETYLLSDAEIKAVIMNGSNDLMPALSAAVTEAEADAVIRYIKIWWTEEQLASQELLNQ